MRLGDQDAHAIGVLLAVGFRALGPDFLHKDHRRLHVAEERLDESLASLLGYDVDDRMRLGVAIDAHVMKDHQVFLGGVWRVHHVLGD